MIIVTLWHHRRVPVGAAKQNIDFVRPFLMLILSSKDRFSLVAQLRRRNEVRYRFY